MLVPWALGGLVVSLSLLILFTIGPIGLVVISVLTLFANWVANRVVERELPHGWLVTIAAGLAGGWLVIWVLQQEYGPAVGGVALIPALFGAVNARVLVEVFVPGLLDREERPDSN